MLGAAFLLSGAAYAQNTTADVVGTATDASGATTVIATDPKRRWIDCVAIGPAGSVAWSAGKTAYVRTGKGAGHALDVPSTVGALAFLPKGFRLAIAH